MPDEYDVPSKSDLERFRRELVEELEKTRTEVREAFEAAAEPLKETMPTIIEQLRILEERVRKLEARQLEQWPRPPIC